MIQLVKKILMKMSAHASIQTEDRAREETAAMVYVGDIYAVLLHNRAARLLSQEESRQLARRRDAGWPFIR